MKHKSKGSTKKYREQMLTCEERERLVKAYQEALRRQHALKDELEVALRHAMHFMDEILAHERRHGCVGPSLIDPMPTIG
jgi:hypothetical protein